MIQRSGYIIFFEKNEQRDIQDEIRNNQSYINTVPFRISDKFKTIRLNFISFDKKHINYACLIRQGKSCWKDTRPKTELSLYNFIETESICIEELEGKLGQKLSKDIDLPCLPAWDYENSSQYKIEEWQQIIDLIKEMKPKISEAINEMLLKITPEPPHKKQGFDIMAQQKDSIQLSLDFAGFKNNLQLKKSIDNPQNYLSFIKSDEDSLIFHDLTSMKFKSWVESIDNKRPNTRTFKQGARRLTITNVNRNREYEGTLGVDFLFYNHDFNLFVMIQYKVWQKDDDGFFYRWNNQYQKDINRMKYCEESFFIPKENQDIKSYRLNTNPFYFKLCESDQFSYDQKLIGGIYLPYDYLNQNMNERLGTKNGRIVRPQNFPHKIHNDLFINLVRKGLIGSTNINESELDSIILSCINNGNSVTLAETMTED
jgi:hypothetical protein